MYSIVNQKRNYAEAVESRECPKGRTKIERRNAYSPSVSTAGSFINNAFQTTLHISWIL
jgi:hypothetical protein